MSSDSFSPSKQDERGDSRGDGFIQRPQPPKFLIIDDDAQLLQTAARMVRHFKIPAEHILTASDVPEGLALFDFHAASVQVILSDMMMPCGTGLTVYRHVRAERPNLPMAIWSGGMPSDVEKDLKAALAADSLLVFFDKPLYPSAFQGWFKGAWIAAQGD